LLDFLVAHELANNDMQSELDCPKRHWHAKWQLIQTKTQLLAMTKILVGKLLPQSKHALVIGIMSLQEVYHPA
jgi:hypothetical protein